MARSEAPRPPRWQPEPSRKDSGLAVLIYPGGLGWLLDVSVMRTTEGIKSAQDLNFAVEMLELAQA